MADAQNATNHTVARLEFTGDEFSVEIQLIQKNEIYQLRGKGPFDYLSDTLWEGTAFSDGVSMFNEELKKFSKFISDGGGVSC